MRLRHVRDSRNDFMETTSGEQREAVRLLRDGSIQVGRYSDLQDDSRRRRRRVGLPDDSRWKRTGGETFLS